MQGTGLDGEAADRQRAVGPCPGLLPGQQAGSLQQDEARRHTRVHAVHTFTFLQVTFILLGEHRLEGTVEL